MRTADGTVTKAEHDVLAVVWLGGADGADLSDATRPPYGQVESRVARRLERAESRVARRLERAGLLTIDAGAAAHLTDAGRAYVPAPEV